MASKKDSESMSVMSFKASKDQEEYLEKLKAEQGINKSQWIRIAIDERRIKLEAKS